MRIQIHNKPDRSQWKTLLQRPVINASSLEASVANVLKEVKASGDSALRRFTSMFDKVTIDVLTVTADELAEAESAIAFELKQAIIQAKENIEKFHAGQLMNEPVIETMPGVQCWRKNVAIDKVGLYIPGGSAPLFSTILMLAIPAKIAGCNEIILCTPPDKLGKIHPAILYTAMLVGVTKIYKVGGAQAIAAMAYGTETIQPVYKIFGPGNQYVTCAKQLVQKGGIAIDMPAGPSEVAILADDTAMPAYVAADLLAQAEHGADSQVILVTNSERLCDAILLQIDVQLQMLPRKEVAEKALENSKIIIVNTLDEGIAMLNEYAAEHLIICCENDEAVAVKITNAGSVFLGNYSPESVGDYASGTNHTLPTNGYAKAYSGVSVDSFVKKITYQKLSRAGLQNIAATVETMAVAEGLQAHAFAVSVRNKC